MEPGPISALVSFPETQSQISRAAKPRENANMEANESIDENGNVLIYTNSSQREEGKSDFDNSLRMDANEESSLLIDQGEDNRSGGGSQSSTTSVKLSRWDLLKMNFTIVKTALKQKIVY